MTTTVWTVGLAALITALTTGLGAVPFFFVKKIQDRWLGLANGLAAGLMLGASFGLILEGLNYDVWRLMLGVVLGVVLMLASHEILERRTDVSVGDLEGANAIKVLMIMGVMTLHSFSEGVGVGVSFGGGRAFGELITIAIAIHNIPEGLAISLVLVPRGTPVWRAGWWSIFSSLPQPLMAIPAFLFVTIFRPFLPVGLGFAAGAMIWMIIAEIIPDAIEDAHNAEVGVVATLAMAAMIALEAIL